MVWLVAILWSVDALLHSPGGTAGFLGHFFSTRAHDVVPRLITAALFFSLGFFVRAEYLRRRSAAELQERTRLAELGAAIGLILAEEATLDSMLQRCTEAIVQHLDALFARVWLYDSREQVLVLRASAGRYTRLDGSHARIRLGAMKIGTIASERTPHLTNHVAGDPLFNDQTWVRQEGIAAFAGHPLVIGDALLGVMGLFSRRPLSSATSSWLAAIAREIALGIRRHESEEAIRRAEQEWSKTFDAMPDLVFTIDADFRIVKANRAFVDRLGAGGAVAGRRCFELIHGGQTPPRSCPHLLARQDGQMHSVEIDEPKLGGHFLLSVAPLTDAAGRPAGAVHVARDINERRRLEKRLETAAYTDELTGLFNRRGFFALAGKHVELARRRKDAVGLLYVDINLMKEINDRWGHKEGDRAIRDAADLLRRTFRKSDIIGRVGGDEFVVLLTELSDAGSQEAVLANLREALAQHRKQTDRPFTLDLSGGIACSAPGVPCSLEELLIQADQRMYLEKGLSRARLRETVRSDRPKLDLRRAPRVPLEAVAAVLVPGGRATLVDISLGGTCVGTPVSLQVGSLCSLDFGVGNGDGEQPLRASVVWSLADGSGAPVEVRCRSGLRFEDAV
jgi:diguanylate cyclase (GGDEF)-like protein/PAS domain S-box-containing protein